jgi:hypothetical protein
MCNYFYLQRTTGFSYKNISEAKNHQFYIFEKNQNQRTASPNYLKTLTNQQFSWKKRWRTSGFMGSHFSQNVENHGYISEPIIDFSESHGSES